ncbi:Eukaryotic translation elongation factor 1 gamma [Pelobates cultripes]|uniref:Eukaryotic translation elongation factor 1 gamma n=1 Tax=Pelobates cultripes TaxID=61616 RepID=A0AAD1RP59_PELCU|nr:Eukaryotic translation elongation factor 1 gamma [Pelobates cultripes]
MKLCDKMAQYDAKKFAELQPKKETPKKEKPPKEPKKEKEEKKQPPAPAPEEEMDEADQALAAEPKSKDPYAHLPKSLFSNEDTLTVALPYFWEHFDKEGWSIWYSEYRFPDELTHS